MDSLASPYVFSRTSLSCKVAKIMDESSTIHGVIQRIILRNRGKSCPRLSDEVENLTATDGMIGKSSFQFLFPGKRRCLSNMCCHPEALSQRRPGLIRQDDTEPCSACATTARLCNNMMPGQDWPVCSPQLSPAENRVAHYAVLNMTTKTTRCLSAEAAHQAIMGKSFTI